MDHEAHVRLVNAHAEGVGGDDDPQVAADETLLDVFLGLRRQSPVEIVRRYTLLLQELRHLCAVPPRGAVDDGAARHMLRQVFLQYLVNIVELRRAAGRHHHEVQVGAPGAAVEDPECNAQLLTEIVDNLVLHVRLGGGSQA